jgi:phage gp36-like protein
MARTYNYCSADTDVRELLDKLTDGIRDDTEVSYWIEKADDYIDARLGQIYLIPFTTTPPMVKHISTLLASAYTLESVKLETSNAQDAWIKNMKDEAEGIMTKILNGDAILFDSSGNEITTIRTRGIVSSTLNYRPVFNEGDETGWGVSEDKIEDEQDRYE